MGKQVRRGKGPRSSSSLHSLTGGLRRRISEAGLEASTDAAAVADHLRSRFHEYSRIKFRPFSLLVQEALASLRRHSVLVAASEAAGDESLSPSRSNRRKRLRASSEDSTPTSDDSVFDEPVEPEFDLTKSMLRDCYGKKATLNTKSSKDEENVEIEMAVEKPRRMEMADGSGVETPVVEKVRSSRGGGEVGGSGEGRLWPRFRDLGGMKAVIEELEMEVIVPLCHPELPRWLGVQPMAGLLLHGPPGCGKTTLAHAIANETGIPFYKVAATEVVSGVSGASEENIRNLFKKAYRTAPSIVFIDEIDAIASKRENLQREMERRIVTQLMACMDEFHQTIAPVGAELDENSSARKPGYVLVIGATNRIDAVDQALRRPGRFDREIALGVPDQCARIEILSMLTNNLRLDGQFNISKMAKSTPGFVGADLKALVNKAGNLAMKRIIDQRKSQLSCDFGGKNIEDWWRQPWDAEEMEKLSITMADFEEAAKMVQPSLRREGFTSIPDTTWEDVGGLNLLKEEFDNSIVQRIKHPEDYEEFGVALETGILLYGPPGCGKTLIAKAVANEAGANFIHIKGPEILNKYVGESELEVRKLFARARTNSPCILFFDEVDALITDRGKEGGSVVERLVNQILVELDGADPRQGVYVIGATNRIEVMDPAAQRPGRFEKTLYVPLPGAEERASILKAHARKKPIAPDVDLNSLAHRKECENLTGADLAALMNEAAMTALKEKRNSVDQVTASISRHLIKASHFEQALLKVAPSVSEEQRNYYEATARRFKAVRG